MKTAELNGMRAWRTVSLSDFAFIKDIITFPAPMQPDFFNRARRENQTRRPNRSDNPGQSRNSSNNSANRALPPPADSSCAENVYIRMPE
jgi:hypothetical protein